MARYTEESVDRVRDAIDMIDLVGSKTELRRAGAARYEGLCPFHEERTPSFGIDPVKKLYHCFGCGAGGDAISFVRELEGVDFVGAIELLADRFGVQLEVAEEDPREAERRRARERLFELLDRTASYYERVLWESGEAAAAREYLLGRGLTAESLRAFRVGYSPSAWDRVLLASRRAGYSNQELYDTGLATRGKEGRLYDRFRARIMFPLWDARGRVIGFGARAMGEQRGAKYINTPESPLFHKGSVVYGAHLARASAAKAGQVIVAEGYTDVIALHQAGVENVVASMGTALTDQQVGLLKRLAGQALLAMDADAAGQEAMLRAAKVAGEEVKLFVVPLPAGKDPADLVASSAQEFTSLLERPTPIHEFVVQRLLDKADLTTSHGRDDALKALAPVYATIPNKVLEEELLRVIADAVDLHRDTTLQLLRQYRNLAPRRAPADAAPAARAPAQPLTPSEEVERTFLALCLGQPALGREALDRIDFDEHLTTPLHRRVAALVREHIENPMEAVPPDDDELRSAVSELEARRSRDPATPAALDAQRLQLELGRLTRRLNAARRAGEPGVTEIAVQRNQVQAELDRAVERAMSTS